MSRRLKIGHSNLEDWRIKIGVEDPKIEDKLFPICRLENGDWFVTLINHPRESAVVPM